MFIFRSKHNRIQATTNKSTGELRNKHKIYQPVACVNKLYY